jgi:hypothetical protein
MVQIILVVGAPGSGTTALMGVLDALGVPVPGPFDRNDDPRTPCTYESIAFTRALRRGIHEDSVEPLPDYPGLMLGEMRDLMIELERGRLVHWKPGEPQRAAFKRPMAGVCLRELIPIFNPTVLFIHRPSKDVETTRLRRHWPSALGAERPPSILAGTLEALIDSGWPFLGVSYQELVRDPPRAIRRVIAHAELGDLEKNLERAVATIRR